MSKTITIDESEYEHLVKLAKFVEDWHPGYVICKYCGEYHPEGYKCLNCGKE